MHRHLPPLQSRITGQRPAAAQQLPFITGTQRIASLARAHQFDPMATLEQAFAQAAKGIGHAIDLGWKGIADQRDMQGGCAHEQQFQRLRLRCCDAFVTDL
ncbi:hypothetical protein D3C76_914870 [compost metagenome]